MPTLDLMCAQTHPHISGRFFYSTSRNATITHPNTHTQLFTGDLFNDDTHPYPCPRLMACTNAYFTFTFTRAFPLHACGVTRNWRTYFTSVRRVVLVETVVLQTVLWDIRAWSVRFLVSFILTNVTYRSRASKVKY